jgi:ComF family protein
MADVTATPGRLSASGRTDAQTQALCPGCRQTQPPWRAAHVAFDYAFPWDGLIQQWKFAGRTALARPFAASILAALPSQRVRDEALEGTVSAGAPPRWLVPVPSTPGRLAERGYNPTELLAQALSAHIGIPVAHQALIRPRDAPHQSALTRAQRLGHLQEAFVLSPAWRARLQGARLVLVDDVVTTGATAAAATRELLRAGAISVDVWAVARTP